MRDLNIILTLFFVMFCIISKGQRKSDLPIYDINCSNDTIYYKKARQFLNINNRDSLLEAYMILTKLCCFDSIKYSKEILKPYYKKIEATNLSNIKTNIIERWNFEWSGSNWGTAETYKNKKEKMIITNNEVPFFHGDTLVRQTVYTITNEFSTFKEFVFQIYFHDDKTINDIFFETSGTDYTAHLKFSNENIVLYFEATGFCHDCGYTIYMKESATNYRMEQ